MNEINRVGLALARFVLFLQLMKMKFTYTLLCLGALLVGCSNYSKIVKGDDYKAKAEYADQLFNAKKYNNSIVLYEQVYQRYAKQIEGENAYFKIGKAYYLNNDYYMAGYFLGQFTQRFPFSASAEEATFLSALCSVKNSPNYSLDQTETETALNNLQQFVDQYPNSTLIDSCNNIMNRLRFKLETKDYEHVKLYDRTMNYRSAVTASEIFIRDYPKSTYREEAFYILVNNSQLLTKNSVEAKKIERAEQTIERLRIFGLEYPSSKYLKNFKSLKVEMEKEIEKTEKSLANNKDVSQ